MQFVVPSRRRDVPWRNSSSGATPTTDCIIVAGVPAASDGDVGRLGQAAQERVTCRQAGHFASASTASWFASGSAANRKLRGYESHELVVTPCLVDPE